MSELHAVVRTQYTTRWEALGSMTLAGHCPNYACTMACSMRQPCAITLCGGVAIHLHSAHAQRILCYRCGGSVIALVGERQEINHIPRVAYR